jgi:coenzyme F420-0:L-glutamate ligase/coenzyme F420-1:gamma-L-glutamate ligase
VAQLDERARRFLQRQRVAHLATATSRGVPHVVPICFEVLDESVYIALDEKPKTGDPRMLRRVKNIIDNPRVAITADVYDEDWSQLGFVLLHARGRLVETSEAEHTRAVQALRSKYVQYVAMALEDRPIIAADIERVTVWGKLEPDA